MRGKLLTATVALALMVLVWKFMWTSDESEQIDRID